MGYDVHITRKEEWFSDEGEAIPLEEWQAYVAADPEMRLDGVAEATTPEGTVLRVENPGLAVWVAYSGHDDSGNMAWFSHHGDKVSVKNPDDEILRKMHAIASALGARVQGDEGELYDADGQPRAPETADRPPAAAGAPRRPWWKFW